MPVTRSGFTMGSWEMFSITARRRFFMEWRPMAAKVPRMVAAKAEITATDRVTHRASMMVESANRAWYHLREKPVQLPMVLASLKE